MSSPVPGPYVLRDTCLRLRPDNSAEPIHIGDDFWQRLMSGKLGTFHREYLVTTFAYDKTGRTGRAKALSTGLPKPSLPIPLTGCRR